MGNDWKDIKIDKESLKYVNLAIETQLLQWVSIFLGVLIFGMALYVNPIQKYISDYKIKTDSMKYKVSETKKVAGATKDFDLVLQKMGEEWRLLQEQTILPGQQSKVISLLTRATNALDITITNIKPQELVLVESEKPRGPLIPVKFELEIKASYEAIGNFLKLLEESNLIMNVESFSASPSKQGAHLLNAQFVLVAYQENL